MTIKINNGKEEIIYECAAGLRCEGDNLYVSTAEQTEVPYLLSDLAGFEVEA
jgi:hypothetical protein